MADSKHTLPGCVRELHTGQACLACLASDPGLFDDGRPVYAFYREDGSLITALRGRHLAHHALAAILAWDALPKAKG